MAALGPSQVTHVSNEPERFPKIAEVERPLDAVASIAQISIRSLRLKIAPSPQFRGGQLFWGSGRISPQTQFTFVAPGICCLHTAYSMNLDQATLAPGKVI
jgi:hypothetical protein